jgi:hypothetical protein
VSAKSLIVAVIVLAAVAGFVGLTTPGHQILYKLDFTAACDSGCS